MVLRGCGDIPTGYCSGVYTINPTNNKTLDVFCDTDTAGGPWTVIANRYDGSVDFFRTWNDYKIGFGNLEGDFWLGFENLRVLLAQGMQLRIEMEATATGIKYVEYSTFYISDEASKYVLTIGGFSSPDGLYDALAYHNGRPFSTYDYDNDSYRWSCSGSAIGAWWVKSLFVKLDATADNFDFPKLDIDYLMTTYCGTYLNHWQQALSVSTSVIIKTTGSGSINTHGTLYDVRSTRVLSGCGDIPAGRCSGVYTITPTNNKKFDVFCDMDTADGPWTVVANRYDGYVDFFRKWNDYKVGFGNLEGDFWLGFENLRVLLARDMLLRIEMEATATGIKYVEYSTFYISDETSKYALTIGGFSSSDGLCKRHIRIHGLEILLSKWHQVYSRKNGQNDVEETLELLLMHSTTDDINICKLIKALLHMITISVTDADN
ncbi:uncharacterized protein LOC117318037 [Pecten maximus]|uniref:uncharacterized protein LOC117318037 n=1 Tax=Pecten maximus TaxID=6579 RepID=UPI0014585FE3|nr:uncharacterized protein LOC117318037 [Pecten maximus]